MILANPNPELSVVLPAHNEAENLLPLLQEIHFALSPLGRTFEILVMDDNSTDNTDDVLSELQHRIPQIVHCRLEKQSGQSAALAAGFDQARGQVIITLDADGQNDPADIPTMLDELNDQTDVVIGWRKNRRDTWTKRVISRHANRIRRWAIGDDAKDTGCGLKIFKSHCLKPIARFDGFHRFFPALVKMYGFVVAQVPVNHRPRHKGKTHYNLLNRSIKPIVDLLAVRWLKNRALRYAVVQEHALVKS